MYCPQCGLESSPGLQYCRSCGANLKVIGKAVALSEAIARSDRGPIPKLKEIVKSLKVDQVTEEVSRALDHMNKEIIGSSEDSTAGSWWPQLRKKKTAEERREDHLTKGTVSMFTGFALMIFLYYFSAALILKLPPEWIARVPFEIEPVVRIIWLLGLIPIFSGAGHIVAGLLVRPSSAQRIIESPSASPNQVGASTTVAGPASITESTTELLAERRAGDRSGKERERQWR